MSLLRMLGFGFWLEGAILIDNYPIPKAKPPSHVGGPQNYGPPLVVDYTATPHI